MNYNKFLIFFYIVCHIALRFVIAKDGENGGAGRKIDTPRAIPMIP